MNTLKIVVIALSWTAVNSGLLLASHGSDSNIKVAQFSNDTKIVGEKKEGCTACPVEKKLTLPEKKVRKESSAFRGGSRDR